MRLDGPAAAGPFPEGHHASSVTTLWKVDDRASYGLVRVTAP
jgi:hypothetical protein